MLQQGYSLREINAIASITTKNPKIFYTTYHTGLLFNSK